MPDFRFQDEPKSESAITMNAMNDTGGGINDSAEQAAIWLIHQLDDESMQLFGTHIQDFDLWVLSNPITALAEDRREDAAQAVTHLVSLVRSRVDRCNKLAWPSGQVAPGLWVPWSIENRYETLHETEFPWGVSLVFQNAFLGNPLASERGPWKNRRPRNPSTSAF
jgi:hypothetical protein